MGADEPIEPVTQIEASDWTDMDLLTRELAGELLAREIDSETAYVARIEHDGSLSTDERTISVQLRTRRIDAMRRRLADLAGDPAPRMT